MAQHPFFHLSVGTALARPVTPGTEKERQLLAIPQARGVLPPHLQPLCPSLAIHEPTCHLLSLPKASHVLPRLWGHFYPLMPAGSSSLLPTSRPVLSGPAGDGRAAYNAMPSLFPESLCCHPGPPCLLPCLFPVLLDGLPHPTAVHVALSRHTSPCRCGTPDAWHRAWHMLDTLCIQAKHVNKQMNNGFLLSVSTQPWEGEEGSIYL